MKNKEIARSLHHIAEFLLLTNENPFRIRAYENAALSVESLTASIEELAKDNKLEDVPGIGEGVAEKIREYLKTGRMQYLEDLKKKFPPGLLEIMEVPGMGPKKAKVVFDKLKITDLKALKKAASDGKLSALPGFGEKTEQNILRGIGLKEKSKGRALLSDALNTAEAIIEGLSPVKEIKQISPAGSLRRGKETIGDIDILCTVEKGKDAFVVKKFTQLPAVSKVLAAGETKASIITDEGIQVDLRVLEPHSYGSALLYFTGSKEHNIALRELANRKGYTINEYGVFKLKQQVAGKTVSRNAFPPTPSQQPAGGKVGVRVAGKTEEEIYRLMGLQYIPPELRENRGEIEAASKNALPELVEPGDIKGDTHVHSKYSDGADTIQEIAQQGRKMKYGWVIVCDHSQSLKVAGGISPGDIFSKIDEIKKVNSKSTDIKLLCGAEVDVLSDGKLDYPDEVLKELDFVVCSIHTGFKQTEEQITNRVISAFQNKYVHSFSHPTGRLLGKREPYQINLERVLEEAKKCGVFIEINAYPERMELTDIYCKKAKELGVRITIGTDAHHIKQMHFMQLGVFVARRGWLEKRDVINTLPYEKLVEILRERR